MLRVAFYYQCNRTEEATEIYPHLLGRAIKAVRLHMPFAEIWHLNGPNVPKHPSVDKNIEYPHFRRIEHQALMPPGDTLFLDVDCLVQEDIYPLFYENFDAAICLRQHLDADMPPPSWRKLPYNAGVIMSRSQDFWQAFAKHHASEDYPWDDFTTCRFIENCGFNIKRLPGARYCYFPERHDEDLSGRAIVHFKGKRKYWMKHHDGIKRVAA